MTKLSPVDEAQVGQRVIGALARGPPRVAIATTGTLLSVKSDQWAAAEELFVELLVEAVTEQVEGKGVHTGVGEGQDPCTHTGDEVAQGRVHLAVVVGAVEVDHVAGEPADSEQTHKHQHRLSQAFPGLNLWG